MVTVYSQYCELYHRWAGRLKPTMRQQHRAGEKTLIDYSGKHPHLVDRKTGEEIAVELFVAALGASCYTYAEATETQKLRDWISAHTRMVEYFGGVTEIWVPDQLKSAVTRSCRYEPGVNRSYQDLAAHYGAVVVPARPGKARDKAKVEPCPNRCWPRRPYLTCVTPTARPTRFRDDPGGRRKGSERRNLTAFVTDGPRSHAGTALTD